MRRMMGLLALVLAGCVGAQITGAPETADALAGTSWVLTELNGQAPVGGGDVPTLEFGEDQAGGNSGCNFFSGPYSQTGASLRFGPLASTRRACVDPAGNAQEMAYFQALKSTTRATTSGERLVLYAGDRVVARLRAADG